MTSAHLGSLEKVINTLSQSIGGIKSSSMPTFHLQHLFSRCSNLTKHSSECYFSDKNLNSHNHDAVRAFYCGHVRSGPFLSPESDKT